RFGASQRNDVFIFAKCNRPGWANTCTHWFQSFTRAIETHVALHLEMHLGVVLGHSKGAGIHAVATIQAAWLQRGEYNAILGSLDSICRTDQGTCRLDAMHTDSWHRSCCL